MMMKTIILFIAISLIAATTQPLNVPEESEIGKLLKESVTNGLSAMYKTPYKLKKVREMKSTQTINGLKFNLIMDYDIGTSQTKITV
jgi:hypothetical protein